MISCTESDRPDIARVARIISSGLPLRPRWPRQLQPSAPPERALPRAISARERGRPIPRSLPESCAPSGPLGREGAFSCAYARRAAARNPMPKRTDISTILIIGAGPIIIGQACEFDYSGTQACKALRAEGYRIVLINSNPATIMTDPDMADRTYIEPITPEIVAKIIAKERYAVAGRLRASADHGRPDGAQLRALLTQDGRARKVRRRDDRRERRGDRQGRGSRTVPRGDDARSGSRRRARTR